MKNTVFIIGCSALILAGCAPTSNQTISENSTATSAPTQAESVSKTAQTSTQDGRSINLQLAQKPQRNFGDSRKSILNETLIAPCTFKGEGFSRSFTSPGKVSLPIYKSSNVALEKEAALSCTYEGETHTQKIFATNLTGRNRAISQGIASGLICGSLCQQAAMAKAMVYQPGDVYGFISYAFVID